MGISSISPWSLLLILAIIALLFGTKRLRHMGKDLGAAMQGFKEGMKEHDKKELDTKSDVKPDVK